MRSREIAQDLDIAGVPSFLFDGRMLKGSVSEGQLEAFVR
jgi:predicted DsbA family dithiol-disulfide isomerase